MSRRQGFVPLLLFMCVIATQPQRLMAAAAEEDNVRNAVQSYVTAFNSRDASAVAEHWSEQAVHIIRNTGEKTTGRDNIKKQFAELFKQEEVTKLSVAVNSVRFVTDTVAKVEGAATVTVGEESPSETTFSALYVMADGKWLMDSVDETVMTDESGTYDPLLELEWLVGQWADQSAELAVTTSVRWSANNSFLIRNYTLQQGEEIGLQGTQIIGWDPKQQQIRSWVFDSDGSFGEGTWSRNGDSWMVKMSRTTPDGGSASGTQVISLVDENTINVRNVGQDINGAPIPASDPITVFRITEAAVETSDATEETAATVEQ